MKVEVDGRPVDVVDQQRAEPLSAQQRMRGDANAAHHAQAKVTDILTFSHQGIVWVWTHGLSGLLVGLAIFQVARIQAVCPFFWRSGPPAAPP